MSVNSSVPLPSVSFNKNGQTVANNFTPYVHAELPDSMIIYLLPVSFLMSSNRPSATRLQTPNSD